LKQEKDEVLVQLREVQDNATTQDIASGEVPGGKKPATKGKQDTSHRAGHGQISGE
jgi:hypothetical protein